MDGTQDDVFDVLIIGAGFAGLGAGAGLAAESEGRCSFKILEKGGEVGAFWSGGHEDLSLHSPWHSCPHDGGLAHEFPMFKSKHQVREYLARYAAAHDLLQHVGLRERVTRIEHRAPPLPLSGGVAGESTIAAPDWTVSTDSRVYRARRVIVATGLNREPHSPTLPGAAAFSREHSVCHSWEVENCREYRGKRVLVVGSGNSAAELATSLHREGAAAIMMLVDSPRHFVRRSTLGLFFSIFPFCEPEGLESGAGAGGGWVHPWRALTHESLSFGSWSGGWSGTERVASSFGRRAGHRRASVSDAPCDVRIRCFFERGLGELPGSFLAPTSPRCVPADPSPTYK